MRKKNRKCGKQRKRVSKRTEYKTKNTSRAMHKEEKQREETQYPANPFAFPSSEGKFQRNRIFSSTLR